MNNHLRKLVTIIMSFLSLAMLISCSYPGNGTGTNSSSDPAATDRPARQPADNEKPDLISADNKYAAVPVYDKFGAWPAKKGETYYSSEVGTWFTVWWHEEGEPLYDRWYTLDQTRLKPVDYGYYCSGNEDYLTSVFVRMNYIGIDFVLLDDTNGNQSDITANIYNCFKAAYKLNGFTPKLAIATGGAIRDNDDAKAQQEDFDRYFKLSERYPDVFYRYEGKPFLVMYVADHADLRFEDAQSRFTQRYGTGYVSWQRLTDNQELYTTQGNFAWVFDVQNEGTEVMGAQPGYNKYNGGSIDRENGHHYIEQWLAAIKADPRIIMVPSYNDHAEETGWEATTPLKDARPGRQSSDTPGEDPYLYEKITEAYLALRYGYIEGFYYKTEGTDQVFRCTDGYLESVSADSVPSTEPIILLPDGYIEWELNRDRG